MEQEIQVIQENREQEVPILKENVIVNGKEELFFVWINEEVTPADKTSTEIFEATQAGKYAVGVYYNNDTFNIVPFAVIEENIAQCQILFDTDVVQISIDNTGAVTVRNISLAETSDIPQYTSQLTNNSGFITNAVNDLANYYLKSETYRKDEVYNKTEVQELISAIPNLKVVIVQSLPVSGEELTLYFVPRNPGELNNIYDEYIWIYPSWEKIGSTDIDLTDYVKFTDYASSSTGGVVKVSSYYSTYCGSDGQLQATQKSYSDYNSGHGGMFISKGTLENVIEGKGLVNSEDVNSYAGIIVPDTTNMTPIKTIEYDVSSNAYFKFMSVANDFASMDDQYGDCLFRITVSGENIAKNIIEGIYSIRQGENAVPYFAVRNNAGEGTTNSAITGIRYIRVNYPKTMNNGYDYDLEFNCINNNTRHIKIEVFKTTPNITWYDSLTSTTYNSTYQTNTSLTISTTNVINVLGSYTMTVSNATVASYINSYLPKFLSGTLPSAGQAILAQQFIFFSDDNKAYPSSNKTKPIKTGIGIQLCSNNVNLNSSVPNTGLRQKYNNSTLTNIPHATLTAGDDCWFRCTMDANGNILSDNYVATERTPGYTWYYVGMATSATAINTDTTQSQFYTLDANGILTHIDGIPLAQNGNGVSY